MKDPLRLRFRARRDALGSSERGRASAAVWERLRQLPEFANAQTVLWYASFGSEVQTGPMMEATRALHKHVVLPRMREKDLVLHPWDGVQVLVPNRHGIPEPDDQGPLIEPASVDLVIVPGLAFDQRGTRMGYGGGYYDRLLRRASHAVRVAIGYEFQLVPTLPSGTHDAPMDVLVTDLAVHHFRPPQR